MSKSDPLPGRDLAAFVAAVETGSVQEAASALGLTQSAATKRIQVLERTLGTELLHRSRTGVRPTAAGRTLYPDAKEALAALERAEQRVRAETGRGDAVLRIAASHTIGGFVLPRRLAAFRATAPAIEPTVAILNSPAVLASLRAGSADVGFVEGAEDLRGFERIVIGRDEIVAVVAAGHRWARRRSLRPAELAREPYYAREQGSGTLAVATERLAAHGVVLHPSLRMASTPSLKRAVLGGGFTMLSRRTIEDELTGGALVGLPVAGVDLRRDLAAVRRRGRRHPPAARTFWRWLAAQAPPR